MMQSNVITMYHVEAITKNLLREKTQAREDDNNHALWLVDNITRKIILETGHEEFYNNRMRQIRSILNLSLIGKPFTGSHLNRPSSAGSNYIIMEILKFTRK